MAGHSQYSNIVHRKNRQDAKRAKVFSRLAREIATAARSGDDPSMNPGLRNAILAARAQSMPKDNIERAIKRSSAKGGEDYEEIRYEGFGPGGVSVIVEALTDNRNRTASDVRSTFTKFGGSLGETGSVSYLFDHVGAIHFGSAAGEADPVFEAALEAGAEDCESTEEGHDIYCAAGDLNQVRDALEAALSAPPESARLVWRPKSSIPVDEDGGGSLLKMLDLLDDSEDVQRVYANFDIDPAVLERLTA